MQTTTPDVSLSFNEWQAYLRLALGKIELFNKACVHLKVDRDKITSIIKLNDIK